MTFKPSLFSFKFVRLFLIRMTSSIFFILAFYYVAPYTILQFFVALIGILVLIALVVLPLFERIIITNNEILYINYGIVFPRYVRGTENTSWGKYKISIDQMEKFIIERQLKYSSKKSELFTLYGIDPVHGIPLRPSEIDVSLLTVASAWTVQDIKKIVTYVKENYPNFKEVTFNDVFYKY